MRILVLALLCAPLAAAAAPENDPFARDLLVLTDWFEGEFDNEEQRWFQADPRSQTPQEERHVRIHTTHKRIGAPEFGEHVFYVEEYTENNPANVYRQRLVIFSSAPEAGGIRMRQGFFHEPERFLGAQHNPGVFDALRPADAFFLDECDVYWRRVAGQFEGGMRPKACVFGEGELRRVKRFTCGITFDPRGRISSISRYAARENRLRWCSRSMIRIRGRWASTTETCWPTATGTVTNSASPWKN